MQCTRPELLTVLQVMQRIANEFAFVKTEKDAVFMSDNINTAVAALPVISDDVVSFLERINPEAAKADDKYCFFRENDETDSITEHKLGIACVEQELDSHRATAAEKVRKKKVEYVTVAGIEVRGCNSSLALLLFADKLSISSRSTTLRSRMFRHHGPRSVAPRRSLDSIPPRS